MIPPGTTAAAPASFVRGATAPFVRGAIAPVVHGATRDAHRRVISASAETSAARIRVGADGPVGATFEITLPAP